MTCVSLLHTHTHTQTLNSIWLLQMLLLYSVISGFSTLGPNSMSMLMIEKHTRTHTWAPNSPLGIVFLYHMAVIALYVLFEDKLSNTAIKQPLSGTYSIRPLAQRLP